MKQTWSVSLILETDCDGEFKQMLESEDIKRMVKGKLSADEDDEPMNKCKVKRCKDLTKP